MNRAAIAVACLMMLPLAVHGQAQPRRCTVVLDSAEREGIKTTVLGTNENYDVAGNVRMHCDRQPVRWGTDSLSVISGDYYRMVGHATYDDADYRVNADSIFYTRRMEKIEARGHVRLFDKHSGSSLVGPYVDYFRAVKGINDSASVVAMQRPTVRYFQRSQPVDTISQHPYVLVGDVLHGFGQSRLWGNGAVVVEHDSIRGVGDSLTFDRGVRSTARLLGERSVLRRTGSDSFAIYGHEIRAVLEHDSLRMLRAYVEARVSRPAAVARGDTVQLGFAADKVTNTQTWSHQGHAAIHSGRNDITGDSVVVESPEEKLREIRVFGNGVFRTPQDSAPRVPSVAPTAGSAPADTTSNMLRGSRLTARFAPADSAGVTVTRLSGLQAIGDASSLFSRTVQKNGRTTPAINYTRADTIYVVMRKDSAGVAVVQAYGHVNGVQLETASVRRSPDSSRVQVVGPPR